MPRFTVLRTVPSVRIHSPIRSVQAPRSFRARVGIQPGGIDQRSWSPLRLFGPGYPAPALRTVSPVRQENPVRLVPAPRTCRAKVGMQPKGEVQVLSTRAPVLPHSPVRPVPALGRCRAKVGIQP